MHRCALEDMYKNIQSSIIWNSKKTLETTQKFTSTKWTNILRTIYTMQCYAAIRRSECLFHVATWMDSTGSHMVE